MFLIMNKQKKPEINQSRCLTCNKKLGLIGFQCKCENYFCAQHRYSDRHNCTFDYKQRGKELIEKENQTINSLKINSI